MKIVRFLILITYMTSFLIFGMVKVSDFKDLIDPTITVLDILFGIVILVSPIMTVILLVSTFGDSFFLNQKELNKEIERYKRSADTYNLRAKKLLDAIDNIEKEK